MSKQSSSQVKQPATKNVTSAPSGILQRKCAACGTHTVAGDKCDECKKGTLQRKASNNAEQTEVPPIVHEVLNSSGQPLGESTRTFFESRFAYDFSRVRVHTGAKASESAQMIDALAYTVGRDVVFGAGEYLPNTRAGRGLLAHELTHVVQAGNSPTGSAIKIGQADSVQEQAAERNETMAHSAVGHSAANLLQRKKGGSPGGLFSDAFNAVAEIFTSKEQEYDEPELKEYLKYLKDNNDIEDDFNSDNKARAVVRTEMFKAESIDVKTLLVQEMLTGLVFDDDEKAILTILEFVTPDERIQIANKVTYQKLYSKLDDENLDRLYVLLPNLNNFHPRGKKEVEKYTYEEYIKKWETESGQTLMDSERKVLAKGCIGITELNLGVTDFPDLSECYGDFETAWNASRKMNAFLKTNRLPRKAIVFSKRFWSSGRDYTPSKTGHVDMSGYNYSPRLGYTNYDYGLLDEATGKWWHANHCDSRVYKECINAEGKPMGPMTVYESNLQNYSRDLDDFDKQVFCVGVSIRV